MKRKHYILMVAVGIGLSCMVLCRRRKFWLEMQNDELVKSMRRRRVL